MNLIVLIVLLSFLFQVRMKAICVLEAILRKKDDEPYSIISSYFSENSESVVRCCDLPQVSLREKATKVSQFRYKLLLVCLGFYLLRIHKAYIAM
jgi:hypothetical protein